ncbi:hypothetical protein Ancab_020708 [Ancistrocladus abbreviatus]
MPASYLRKCPRGGCSGVSTSSRWKIGVISPIVKIMVVSPIVVVKDPLSSARLGGNEEGSVGGAIPARGKDWPRLTLSEPFTALWNVTAMPKSWSDERRS